MDKPSSVFLPTVLGIATSLVVSSSLAFNSPALAEDATSASGESKSTEAENNSDAKESKPRRVLEGGVKGTAINFEEGLARINEATQVIQESCAQIMKESTRKDTVVMRGPNVLPGGVVIPALGGTGGVMQFGEMPIRRDRLQKYLNHSEQSLAALQTYVDALILPAQQTKAHELYSELRTSMQDALQHLSVLRELASAKRLMNGPIGREALKIHDAMAQMDRKRAQLAEFQPGVTVTTPDEGNPTPSAQ